MYILGVSGYYHDASAAIINNGAIVAAAEEERFTRKKHDDELPINAIRYCLAEANVGANDLQAVVFYDKPILKFHRILETYLSVAPKGLRSYLQAMPTWMNKKLWIAPKLHEILRECGVNYSGPLYFTEHHESHAASAFYPSPFAVAAVVTIDGVGEWATTTIGVGEGSQLRLLKAINYPHSLGLLYSAFTYFTGFKVNSGEYKLMGLAPYGEPTYVDKIKEHVIDIKEDGSFKLRMENFGYLDGLRMVNRQFETLFDGPPRQPEAPLTKREMDIARSIQVVTEDVMLKIVRYAREITGKRNLCLAGGVALNCVANGKLLEENFFDDIWIQPAAGDAGGALGAALAVWYNGMKKPRVVSGGDSMQGSYLGPAFSDDEIQSFLDTRGYVYERLAEEARASRIAHLIAEQNVIGLFQGRMEFGPRSLGNRSIIGDARSTDMQSLMNLKIKYRESFRPFAPSCLEERVQDYFELTTPSPYMLLVAPVRTSLRREVGQWESAVAITERVNQVRSTIPAVTHVDYSARIQTVNRPTNAAFYDIIKAFEDLTGEGIVINTSFNVRGEPIVCTPEDAYRCFMRTEMDYLVLGSFLLRKSDQPMRHEEGDWQQEFALD